ncbi:MAG TPA: hypothetical protein VJV75_01760 [Candidatus Polarisedimenticolia bacterium]|nr:hypothetical protein [Candidatus Polarisedimenticolia bacterium]
MSRSTKATLVFLVLFIGAVVALSLRVPKVECEVCISFHGQQRCSRASAADEKGALQSATIAACGLLAGGMTDTIACQNTPPDRSTCGGL